MRWAHRQAALRSAGQPRPCLPLILDLQENPMVGADIALREKPRWNNVRITPFDVDRIRADFLP